MACGNGHSVALTNERSAFLWGANKQCQLGFDSEMYASITTPKKLIHHEYMNTANKEMFSQIHAKGDFTVLVSLSKNIYVTEKNANQF